MEVVCNKFFFRSVQGVSRMFPYSNFLYVRCLILRNCIRLKVDC